MAEPRLGPDELDRLEDALEGLEFLDELDALNEPSSAVTRRLADFRLILQASRDALPLEEVPMGLLDGVFAEARMSSADIEAPSPRPTRPSFWSRLRGAWLIPGLAVAGSAGLVLLLLQPTLSGNEPAADAGSVAMNDAPAPTAAPEGDVAGAASRAAADEAPAPPPPAAAALEQEADFAATAKSEAASATAAPTPEPEPDPEPEPVEGADSQERSTDGWNAIEEGDKSRKGGDCFSARNHYAKALDDGNDSVRARAYVGLGLCKREEGNEAAANEYFDQARELDQDALDFAGTQSKPQVGPAPKRTRKKASGSKQKNAIEFDEARDPFQ